jgi:hypothetical protein
MSDLSTLKSLADIAVTLSGFSGLIITFQQNPDLKAGSADLVGVTMILGMGLGVAFFAYLPIVFFSFGLSEYTVWLASSLLAVIYTFYFTNFIRVNLLKRVKKTSARLIFKVMITLGFLMPVALLINAMGQLSIPRSSIYIAVLFLALVMGGYSFSRLLLYPLWLRDKSSTQIKSENQTIEYAKTKPL